RINNYQGHGKIFVENILFLFTNTRSTQYAPGDTGPALISLLDQIIESPPYVGIEYDKKTIYCFDNEAFRFAVASAPPNNMVFDDMLTHQSKNAIDYWSAYYHCPKAMDTLSLNDAKQNILLLTQPLADIANNISHNVKQCERHKQRIHEFTGDLTALEKELYIPSVDIETDPLDHPKTVCSDKNCCTQENINGNIKTHYTTSCHSPCYLTHSDGNIVGNNGLLESGIQ
ncbi:unnamed protein product, partial [Oppiella nova]